MSSDVMQEVLALEKQVWQALIDGDAAADEAALHADFLGVYSSGFATRAEHVAQLDQGPTVASYNISDPRLLKLGDDHVCLSYLANYRRPNGAKTEDMYVSSIWMRQQKGWVNVFSQDTPKPGSVEV